ncbi:MAG: WG repeat-containing protein [Bacteroidota bacterium]
MNVAEIPEKAGLKYIDQCQFLLITATDEGRSEVLNALTPIGNEKAVGMVRISKRTYYVGCFGLYPVVLVKSGIGAGGSDSATVTTMSAIDIWKPKAILMIGLGFGAKMKKHKIGDVLVSRHVILYDVKDENKQTIYRAEQPRASQILLDRFDNISHLPPKSTSHKFGKMWIGPLLSGNTRIENKTFRDKLLNRFPQAIGGDLEAKGVYQAASEKDIPWLVVKGISHFANVVEKTEEQRELDRIMAVRSAIGLSKNVFSYKYAFEELGLVPPTQHWPAKVIREKEPPEKEPPANDPPIKAKDKIRIRFKDKRGKVGYWNHKKQTVIFPKYIDGQEFQEDLANVKIEIPEEERKKFIEENLGRLSMEEIRAEMAVKGKWGYIDINGQTVIDFVFDRAYNFVKGRARVVKNGVSFYIDKHGKRIKK